METAMSSETLVYIGILPQHYMASQPRRPWFEFIAFGAGS
jgi:hypothetical protein